MNRFVKAALFSATLAAFAGGAVAQGMGHHQDRAFSKPTERVEARLAYVRTALKITDAQKAQWDAYANSARQSAAEREKKVHEWREKMAQHREEMAQNKGEHQHARPSAVERLDRAQKMHADAIARINARLAVVKPLYDSLSAEQKKVADVVLAPERRGGFGHGHRHGRARA
jgi:chromosome segregation ATPase